MPLVSWGIYAAIGTFWSLPTAILWQGFQGSYSPLFVSNALRLKLWSQSIRLVIDGDWDSIYTHFSAHAKGGYAWFSGDIQAEVVVIACGCWSPRIAQMAGAAIPLTPAIHQMISVGPCPQLAEREGATALAAGGSGPRNSPKVR